MFRLYEDIVPAKDLLDIVVVDTLTIVLGEYLRKEVEVSLLAADSLEVDWFALVLVEQRLQDLSQRSLFSSRIDRYIA